MSRPLRSAAGTFLVCYLVTSLTLSLYGTILQAKERHQLPRVCLLGNAPDEEAAERVFRMWGKAFTGVYYLWNTTSPLRRKNQDDILYLARGAERLSFVQGIELALRRARSISSWKCDYFFTHDDDLDFYVSNAYLDRSRHKHIAGVLLEALGKYRPLVASFPWDAGIRTHKNLADIHARWCASDVGPLVGFDNGMVLYHRSVVDLFVPYSPRGEGGFVGHWTLPAHFINLLVTTSLLNYSVCINSLSYVNTINLDNLSPERRQSERIMDPERLQHGLVSYRSGPRHAYEFPLNNAYKGFLSGALKCIDCSWGRQITLGQVESWRPPHLAPIPRSASEVAKLLTRSLHISHEAFRNNALLNSLSTEELSYIQSSQAYSLRINVFTLDRPQSFLRLWRSLVRAIEHVRSKSFHNFAYKIHVYHDHARHLSGSWHVQRELLRNGTLHGQHFFSHLSSTHLGLRQTVLTSWQPSSDDEFCLFLEDDIEIAIVSLEYVHSMIQSYWHGLSMAPRNLLGISLYRPRYSEVTEQFMTIPFLAPYFLYQYPSSWGEVFAARPWDAFLKWLNVSNKSVGDFLIPNSYTNRWPSSNSWKKALLRWMVQTGSVMLYPNMFGQLSLSTNHLESGANDKLSGNSSTLKAMKEKFTVSLVAADVKSVPIGNQSLLKDALQIDVYGHVTNKIMPLSLNDVSRFDKCTIVMAVCDRVTTWKERVFHFRNASFIDSFLVLWQNCLSNHPPPHYWDEPAMPFPVRIMYLPRNSLNNRFFPQASNTDCIINIDDDFDMPLKNLSFAVKTWQGHFWNHLVGFAGFGRNHFLDSATQKWRYTTARREEFSSIVLPTCLIYHRKYQANYAELPKQVLDYVDQVMNCDDILFNLMVSNITKSGPVVIYGDAYPRYVSKAENVSGLWHRPNHFHIRSDCLNYFAEAFQGMPLRYTKSYFHVYAPHGYGSSPGVPPGLRHHKLLDVSHLAELVP